MRKKSCWVVLLLILGWLIQPVFGEVKSTSGLNPIGLTNGKWGYMDAQGKLAINAQFDYAGKFQDGVAPVLVGKKFGYINDTGLIVIKPEFDMAWEFSEGLGMVMAGKKFGFVDPTGKRIVPLKYDEANQFSEGLAGVKTGNKWGYVDTSGQMVIKPTFVLAGLFSQDLAPVMVGKLSGYIGKDGKMIIAPQFESAWSFSEGLAAVQMDQKFGYIDKTGKIIIQPEFDDARPFAEGRAQVGFSKGGGETDEKWGFIDTTGKMVIDPQFDGVDDFVQGIAAVNFGGKIGLFGDFSGGKWGYIDRNGHYVIGLQFDDAYGFNNGLALINQNKNWGYITPSGRYIWEPENVAKQEKVTFTTKDSGFVEQSPWKINDGELYYQGDAVFHTNFYAKKTFSDGVISVKVKLLKAADDMGYGLVFRANDNANFYAFIISPSGDYKLSKLVNNNLQKLVPPAKSALIKTDEYNTLQVRCEGSKIQCFINGQQVIEINDAINGSYYGYVGILANPQVECKFDDFELSDQPLGSIK